MPVRLKAKHKKFMASPLLEVYFNHRPDARTGAGYSSVPSREPSKPSVGTPMSMDPMYPYSSPDESDYSDVEDDDEENIEMNNKMLAKNRRNTLR